MGEVPRGVTEVLGRRFTITAAGAALLGRPQTGTVRVPLVDVPWREDRPAALGPVCRVCGEVLAHAGQSTCGRLVCVLAPAGGLDVGG